MCQQARTREYKAQTCWGVNTNRVCVCVSCKAPHDPVGAALSRTNRGRLSVHPTREVGIVAFCHAARAGSYFQEMMLPCQGEVPESIDPGFLCVHF